jgi:hypothetical protein
MALHNNPLRRLPALLLFNAMLATVAVVAEAHPFDQQAQASADAASPDYSYRIKVIHAESRAINGGTQVPTDCDMQNFSAYCNESKNPTRQITMVVQGSDGKTFSIACTVESRWSTCTLLPEGDTFDAKRAKHGITVLYRDTKGKDKKQFYQIVETLPPIKPAVAAAPPQQPASAPPGGSPTPAIATPPPAGSAPQSAPKRVLCNFSSTPDGAEITVDGNFVGNTPSAIALTTGAHFVVFSLRGFADWKRKLTVVAGSDVNVTATLQKTQP